MKKPITGLLTCDLICNCGTTVVLYPTALIGFECCFIGGSLIPVLCVSEEVIDAYKKFTIAVYLN